jgi:aldehyde dehydrogenase (NAD+)
MATVNAERLESFSPQSPSDLVGEFSVASPALACGNAVLLKPSSEAPACAALLERVLAPHVGEHVFSVVYGGGDVARSLIDRVDAVSFTGSDGVGRSVAAQAGQEGIPAQCEMGGQNAAIVFDDADPARTAAIVAGAAMGYAGQKCTATRRVIVVGTDNGFLEAFVDTVRALEPASPEAPDSTVGPVISEGARGDVLSAIELGRSSGARILAGGQAPDRDGWFVQPTLVDGLGPDHRLSQEETFGPLVTILTATDVDEAVRIANGVRYGLVTSVHGRDLDRVLAAADGLDTGLIKVNAPTSGVDFYTPFGGEKDSSYGPREQGMAALGFYSTTRTITIAAHGA